MEGFAFACLASGQACSFLEQLALCLGCSQDHSMPATQARLGFFQKSWSNVNWLVTHLKIITSSLLVLVKINHIWPLVRSAPLAEHLLHSRWKPDGWNYNIWELETSFGNRRVWVLMITGRNVLKRLLECLFAWGGRKGDVVLARVCCKPKDGSPRKTPVVKWIYFVEQFSDNVSKVQHRLKVGLELSGKDISSNPLKDKPTIQSWFGRWVHSERLQKLWLWCKSWHIGHILDFHSAHCDKRKRPKKNTNLTATKQQMSECLWFTLF